MSERGAAQAWFDLGERVPYDRRAKKILGEVDSPDSPDVVHVFRRVVRDGAQDEGAVWTTLLPGFPDGSFGWAKVDSRGRRESPAAAQAVDPDRGRAPRRSFAIEGASADTGVAP